MRKVILFILLVSCLLPLGACGESGDSFDFPAVGAAFFSSIAVRNFGAGYEMLTESAKEKITLAEFLDFYDRMVFNTIELIDFSWQLDRIEEVDTEETRLHYVLTYTCENIEPFHQNVQLTLRRTRLDWWVDWEPSAVFEGMEWGDKLLRSTLRQKRGEILDEYANAYAINSHGDTVYVRRSQVVDILDASTRLAALLQMDAAKIREIINRQTDDDYAIIKVFLPETIDQTLSDLLTAIPSVGIDRKLFSPLRYYPQGSTFAHILGYTRPIEGEIDPRRYDVDSRVGADGLEKANEDLLAGYRGREIALIDPKGEKKSPPVYRQEAVDGIDLILTIDYELQLRAESLLERIPEVEATAGAIIALDPKTGDLLAAAGFPDFDPNIFSLPIPDSAYQAMLAPEANRPLYNRITSGRYPPGSTVKPFVAVLSLQENIRNQHFEFTERIDWVKRQWTPTYPDWNAPPITRAQNYSGPVNMENAIVYSDNIYFGYLAMEAGWERLESFFHSLGFDKSFPFDIAVSSAQVRSGGSSSNLQLLAASGYGQGEMLISPLQMAYTFSAFANGGDIMKPRLVKKYMQMSQTSQMTYSVIETHEPEALYANLLTDESLEIINPMLNKVITTGSGKEGRLLDIQTLGKTGTAEIGGNKEREIAWSISFVKGTDYERLVCVMLEVPTDPVSAGQYRHTCIKEMLSP